MVLKTEERMQVMEFSEPLFESRALLWYLRSRYPDGIHWEAMGDLAPYTIGVVKGYEIAKPFYDARRQGVPLEIVDVVRVEQNFLKLLSSRIDLVAANEMVAYELIKQYGWEGKLANIERPIETSVFYIGFSKKSPARVLIPEINCKIKDLHTEGMIENVLKMKEE